MKILIEKSYNGSTIHGDAVMLSRYGEVFDAIDNLYHPNPGPRNEGYPEIERCIDWCYQNNFKVVKKYLNEWVLIRVAQEMEYTDDIDEIIENVMYSDLYTPCKNTIDAIKEAVKIFKTHNEEIINYINKEDILVADKIVEFINEKFTRVRAGGKLNPEGTDSIYFRISSHGFDWHRTIVDFLWSVFKSPKKMPKRIVICHDAENNPPEVTLFEGTPEELLEKEDSKIFERLKSNLSYNIDRDSIRRNLLYRDYVKEIKHKQYIPFK